METGVAQDNHTPIGYPRKAGHCMTSMF
jgi:hypothetical protein